jgi:hypothetical protein
MISNTGPDRIFNFLSTVLAKKIHRIWIETSGADKYILHLVGGLEHESYFSQILGTIIIPTDYLIFFRGVGLNHQAYFCSCSPKTAAVWAAALGCGSLAMVIMIHSF